MLAICLAIESSSSSRAAVETLPPNEVVQKAPPGNGPFEGWMLGVGSAANLGALPKAALEISAFVGPRWRHFSIELGPAFDFPVTTTFQGFPIRTSLLMVDAAACLREAWLAACGSFGGGVLQASGQGLSPPSNGVTPYSFAGVRLLADIPLDRWLQLRPSLELRAALSRTTLMAGGESIWTTPPLSAQLGLALLAQFGPGPSDR